MMMTRSHSRSTSAMLWEASSTVAPRSWRKRSSRPRTQSAVSGSSEAVGSSSSSTSGRIDQRLGERHAGLLPGRELAGRAVERSARSRSSASSAMRSARCVDRVEPAEHLEVLPHGEPVRHVDIGALEIHPVQHLVALARHLGAEHRHAAGGRHDEAQDHGDGGGLAGAVAAEQPGDGARRERERNAVDRPRGLVDLHELVDGDGGLDGQGRSSDQSRHRHDVTLCAASRKPRRNAARQSTTVERPPRTATFHP